MRGQGSGLGSTTNLATPERSIPITPHVTRTRPDKTAEIVARDLVRDILATGSQPGDPLDSEPAMVERYGVSRESLREALRLLEVQGLVVLKRGPGGGAFVGTIDPSNLGRTASLYYQLAGATYRELFEAYALADATLAARAARHPDLEVRLRIMSPYLDHRSPESDVDQYIRHHATFHSDIATLANNRVLEISLGAVGLLLGRHYLALVDARRSSPFVADDHADIAQAIVDGDHRVAYQLMERHVEHVVGLLAETGLDPDAVIGWI